MVRRAIKHKLGEFILYVGLSQYKHEYFVCIGISDRVITDREAERGFASLVGEGLFLKTKERKVAQSEVEKPLIEHLLSIPWVGRAYPKHKSKRGKDWVEIKPEFVGKKTLADLIITCTEIAREKVELFNGSIFK